MEFWFSPYAYRYALQEKYHESPPLVASFYKKTNTIPPKVIDGENAGQVRGSYPLLFAASALAILCSKSHSIDLMSAIMFIALHESCHKPLSMSGIEALNFGTANYMPTDAIGVGFNEELTITAIQQLVNLYQTIAKQKKTFYYLSFIFTLFENF